VWIRQYLTALLNDPALRLPSGLLPIWLDQQVDPAAERLRDNHARVTIQHVVDRSQRSVVLGPAGSGKTFLVRQLVRQLAEEALAQPHALLPLYIPLTFFAGSIEGTLGAQARMRGPAVATLALQRPCILIVDALNDVAPTEQLEVLGMLRRAMQQLGPQGRWLINCRTEQWALFAPWLQTSRSTVWRIRPWNDQTISVALSRLDGRGMQRLARYQGCIELARRPRWLGSLTTLAQETAPLQPGQAALDWVERVFAEAAQAHCLSEASAHVGLILLTVLADAVTRQPQQTISRAAIIALTNEVADGVGVRAEELLALLDATGILDLTGDDEWALRSVLLADVALVTETRHDGPERWRKRIGHGYTLPLLYSLLDEPHLLIRTLIEAQAWDEVQRVLDANEDPSEALAVLEATQRVDIDSGAALGRVWARQGHPDVAVMLLRWAISQGRDDPQLLGLLGGIYLGQGLWAPARDIFKQALDRDPTNLHYQQALARACHELGEDDVATQTLEQAMSTHHQQLAQTAYHLGDVYEQRGRYHEALTQYLTAASLVPNDARFGLAQARVLRLLARFDEARSLLRSLQVMATDPAPLAHEWAALMSAQGNDEQALVHLEHLVELNAADAQVYLQIGQIRRKHNDAAGAHQAFSTAVDLDPRCCGAYEQLAGLAIDLGDLQTAASAYRNLAALKPKDAAVYRQLGALLRQLDQYSDAVQALRVSIQIDPSAEAFLQLARVRWAQGEQADALRHYRAALELSPSDGQIAAETGWALIESGDPVAALEPLHSATLLLPTNARILYDIGRAYELQARRAEALEWYERAAHMSPGWGEALRATGRIAHSIGYTELARSYLARALWSDRRDSDILTTIGQLHLQARNGVRAQRALRRALGHGGSQTGLRRDLAEALLLTGQAREALRWLEHIDDDDADVQSLRSAAYEQLGDPRMALMIARSAAAQRPRDYRLQRRLGALALQAGSISEALVALETAITLGASDAQTQRDLSRALLQAGKREAALRPAELAVERAPHDPASYEQLGHVALALNQIEAAGDAFEQVIALDPERAPAWAGLAEVWHARHSVGAALPYARHALELAPNDDAPRLRLAQLLVTAGDYAEAQTLLATLREPGPAAERLQLEIAVATEQWPQAIVAAERALQAAPNDSALLATYGLALFEAGRTAESIPPLVKACARPDAPAAWWSGLGRAYLALGQWPAAANAIEHSLQIDPQQLDLYVRLAHAYMQQGQPITAAQTLQAALEHDGDRADWRALLADAYEALGWKEETLREWQHAQRLDPLEARYSREVGRLHLALNDPTAALVELESAAAIDASDRAAWELLAQAALAADEPARAVHAAASALGLAPSAPEPRRLLGEALLRRGEAERALQCLQPLLDSSAVDTPTLLLIHAAAQAAKQPQLAQRALETAYRNAPEDLNVQLRLAAHFKPSEPARALKILRALAQRHPQRADIAAALAEHALDLDELHIARSAAERAVDLAPDHHHYRRLLGHICFRLGDHGAARTSLQQVLAHRPHDAATALTLGKLALERNEATEAIRLLQLAAQSAPDAPDVQGALGLAIRQRWQPVWEDELVEPQGDPVLHQAIEALTWAADSRDGALGPWTAVDAAIWRSELGWTRLIAGDVAGAAHDLAEALRQIPAGSANRALALRRLALTLLQARQLDEAVTISTHAAALAPTDPLVASIQGQLAEQRGDIHQAVQCYARAVALDPEAGRHHLRLGAVLLQAGEIEVALDHLEQATQLEPARGAAWMLLSRALLRVRQPDRALSAAQRAIQLSPGDGATWRQLAAAAETSGQIEVALEAFERATTLQANKLWLTAYADLALAHDRDARGRAALQQAAQIDPNDAELAHRLALLSQGQERISYLERAIQLDPANVAWRGELARLLATRGQHRAAITHLAQTVDADPHTPAHWTALAEALLRSGDDGAAETNLRRGLEFTPGSAALWLALGNLLATRRQWIEAFESFVHAAECERSATAYAGQGHCLLALYQQAPGRPANLDQARDVLLRAVELDAQDAEAWADLGRTAFLQGRWKEAIRDARRAVALSPTLVDAYRTVAESALELKGDWINDAHDALEHALAIEPDAPDLHALLGWAYFAEGAYEEALHAAQVAIRNAPDEATYYLLEAYALRRLRRFKEAIEALRKAVKLNRNYREALQELMTLTSELFMQGERA
jgi:superkiller protein 3